MPAAIRQPDKAPHNSRRRPTPPPKGAASFSATLETLSGGLPFTPYDRERSSLIAEWDARHRPYPDNSRYNSGREPAYHQLDVRVDKIWYFDHWRLGFYIDVQNVYNYSPWGRSILAPATDADGKYIVSATAPDHYEMQEIPHDIGGTVLPTIGITFEF